MLPADRPALMGILNVTPDSFSERGLNYNRSVAIAAAKRMVDEGADLIDIGGESTRPGSNAVPVEEEIARVCPVIEAAAGLGVPISVDTKKHEVARVALEAGASIVNDVSALGDPQMVGVCADSGCLVCLMHMKGDPSTMQRSPAYDDVVAEVTGFLLDRSALAISNGIGRDRIWLDPGIGFGKTVIHNLELLHSLPRLVASGHPILVGVSRKSFIGAISGADVDCRIPGTLAAQVLAQVAGVRVIRAHDVGEARQSIDVAAAILRPSLFSKRPA